MHECERIRSLPSEEKLEKVWRNLEEQILEWDERVWERNQRSIKREIKQNEGRIAWGCLNKPAVNLDRWRCREMSRHLSRKVSRKRSSTDTGIEEVSRNTSSDIRSESRSIQQVSRSYRGGRSILDRSTRCQGAVGIAIRKSWRSSTDSKVLRKYWGGVELAFKTSFSRCEKHRHACNPTCNSTNDPINILSSQNHLSIKFLSTWIFKSTHTHTKQV